MNDQFPSGGSVTPTALYRGRLAPSPTGYLHLGHARTFWIAQQRAQEHSGVLVLRNEDLDPDRCKPEYAAAMIEDLRWFGFRWQEGPDCGGAFAPYAQSERRAFYVTASKKLREGGFVYPCTCSRRDVQRAAQAPHAGDEEPIYPGTCRSHLNGQAVSVESPGRTRNPSSFVIRDSKFNWRFRVPDGEVICFVDRRLGEQAFTAGKDFGDFVIWRHDDVPSYQLAVVVDDAAMRITEVVRGEDLLLSTARQLLLYRALGLAAPGFYHCPLVVDAQSARLAKRHDALSLRTLRARGATAESLRRSPEFSSLAPR